MGSAVFGAGTVHQSEGQGPWLLRPLRGTECGKSRPSAQRGWQEEVDFQTQQWLPGKHQRPLGRTAGILVWFVVSFPEMEDVAGRLVFGRLPASTVFAAWSSRVSFVGHLWALKSPMLFWSFSSHRCDFRPENLFLAHRYIFTPRLLKKRHKNHGAIRSIAWIGKLSPLKAGRDYGLFTFLSNHSHKHNHLSPLEYCRKAINVCYKLNKWSSCTWLF